MPDAAAASPSSNKRQRLDPIDPSAQQPVGAGDDAFIQDHDAGESGADDDDDDEKPKSDKKAGRRKIKIEFIQDKSRRHITFSKRKAGIMKKAYELSTLTGTQVLLLVVSETGLVYTFTTAKLQPLVTQPEGKNLIQACLNAPHGQLPSSMPVGTPLGRSANPMGVASPHTPAAPSAPPNVPGGLAIGGKDDDAPDHDGHEQADAGEADRSGSRKRRRASSTTTAPSRPPPATAPPPTAAPAPAPTQQQQQQPAQQQPGQAQAQQATSPHQRQPMPLPSQLAIPGAPGGPQQGQAAPQGMAPQSPSYATYAGGDPNAGMYAGYAGQPPPGPPQFGYPPPGHDQQPQGMATWGGPGVQQGGHYARR